MEKGIDGTRPWDPLVRLTHWGIAAAVLANALFTEEGGAWHVWVGTAMAGLLGLRLVWGVIGPAEARFSAFPPSPARAMTHLKDILAGRHKAHRSHNGLGALMIYAIWGTLSVVVVTGLSMSGFPPETSIATSIPGQTPQGAIEASSGRDAGDEDSDDDEHRLADHRAGESEADDRMAEGGKEEAGEWAEELHEGAVNLLYGLIVLHVLGVLMESIRTGPAVIGRMIGRRD